MDALLTFIFVVILIFFVLRLLFPIILRFFIRRITGFNPQKNQNVAYKKGETTIISHGKQDSEVPKDFGDYTDYEEIKNKK
jgi:hypothetical protein